MTRLWLETIFKRKNPFNQYNLWLKNRLKTNKKTLINQLYATYSKITNFEIRSSKTKLL